VPNPSKPPLAERLAALEARVKPPLPQAAEAKTDPWRGVIEFVVPIVGGLFLGRYIMHEWNTGPWPVIFFLLLGLGAGFMALFRRSGGYRDGVGLKKRNETE
jgi:F0F1-type ATP synthase assembly protein I